MYDYGYATKCGPGYMAVALHYIKCFLSRHRSAETQCQLNKKRSQKSTNKDSMLSERGRSIRPMKQILCARREWSQLTRQQESPQHRQQCVQTRRKHKQLRRQQESREQCQQCLNIRRKLCASMVDKFKADLLTSLVHCHICHFLTFTDKVKTVSCTDVTKACPSEIPNEPGTMIWHQATSLLSFLHYHLMNFIDLSIP